MLLGFGKGDRVIVDAEPGERAVEVDFLLSHGDADERVEQLLRTEAISVRLPVSPHSAMTAPRWMIMTAVK